MYLILVAVDVSDFAVSDLSGGWIREKFFCWSRFPVTCVFRRYIVGFVGPILVSGFFFRNGFIL